MGELLKLSQTVTDFAARTLGVDIEHAGLPNAEEEFQMGSRLVELGTVMQARATERAGREDGSASKADSIEEC
jgi:hypothetical protein